jgi:hypothetical protein
MAPQFDGRTTGVMVRVPHGARQEAALAFELAREGFRGGRETGWRRAGQLRDHARVSIYDVLQIRNWYARHRGAAVRTFDAWVAAGRPRTRQWHGRNGVLATCLWGGAAALAWVNSAEVRRQLERAFPDRRYGVIRDTATLL